MQNKIILIAFASLLMLTASGNAQLTITKGNGLSNLTAKLIYSDPQCAEYCHFIYNVYYNGITESNIKSFDITKFTDFTYSLNKINQTDNIIFDHAELIENITKQVQDVPIIKRADFIYPYKSDFGLIEKVPEGCKEYDKDNFVCTQDNITGYDWREITILQNSYIKSIDMVKGKQVTIDLIYKRTPSVGKKATDIIPTFFGFSFPEFAWANSSWTYRKNLTVNASLVNGTHLNFTALINITDSNLSTFAQSNGFDIFFTNETDNKLNHEIELYEPATGHLIAWVQIPNLTNVTMLWMYYNNSAASNQQNPQAVWDSNYAGVWHITNGTILSVNNSVTKVNATYNASITATAGIIDGAANNIGSGSTNNRIITDIGTNSNTRTYEEWMYRNSSATNTGDCIWSKGTSAERERLCHLNAGNYLAYQRTWSTKTGVWNFSAPANDSWYHVVITYDSSSASNDPIMYYNGQVQTLAGKIAPTGARSDNADVYLLMSRLSVGQDWKGNLDEFRIEDVIRNAQWINTEYNNQANQAAFWQLGTEGTQPVNAFNITIQSPTNTTYTNGSTNYNLTFNYTPTASGLTIDRCWYKLNATANVSLSATSGTCINGTLILNTGINNITLALNSTTGIYNETQVNFTYTMTQGGNCWTCEGSRAIIPTGTICKITQQKLC